MEVLVTRGVSLLAQVAVAARLFRGQERAVALRLMAALGASVNHGA